MDARTYLESLVGKTIYTLGQRKPNRVLAIEGNEVLVATEKSPQGEPVPIAWVQDALDRLCRDREVLISVQSVGYRSAFIGAAVRAVRLVDLDAITMKFRECLTA